MTTQLQLINDDDDDDNNNNNNNIAFPAENRTVYEIMWENSVERGGAQMTIWRMRTACWITKATVKYSQYVIVIAFPLQQWLQESA